MDRWPNRPDRENRMARSKGQRDRPRREKRSPKSRKPGARAFRSHPLFGEIPLVEQTMTGGDGTDYRYYDYDLTFEPDMPSGAVRGDVRKQHFCSLCHTPRYFFVDLDRQCVQCGADFVFSAKEQKYWYETLQFPFDSVAIRCPPCRAKRRTDKALRQQMSAARQGLKDDPERQRDGHSEPHAGAEIPLRSGNCQ